MNTEISILFDWGGVLAPSDNKTARAILEKAHNIDGEAFMNYCKEFEDQYGDTDEDQGFLEEASTRFSVAKKDIAAALNAAHPHEGYAFAKDMSQQYPVYIVSNQIKFRTDYIKENFDLSFFKKTFFSNEIQLLKPHKAFFEHVLHEIGTSADQCVFVDDNADNCTTARDKGFQVVEVTDVESMKNDFKQLGFVRETSE